MTYGYLSDSMLLTVWEWGSEQPMSVRALEVLAAAYPKRDPTQLEALPIGQRDRLLMQVRQQTFGPQLNARVKCPVCDEALELSLPLAQILDSEPERESSGEWFSLEWADWEVAFRLPTGGDFVSIAVCGDAAMARQYLLERCVRSKHHDQSVGSHTLPPEILDKLREEISLRDPLSDVQLAMNCAICDAQWNTRLEIIVYLWAEICAEAQLILQEVHQLASAYRWRESDILMMSRQRRHHYIGLLGYA